MERLKRLTGLLARFGLVGIAATATYLAVANALIIWGHVPAMAASVIGYLAGMITSFIGQSRLTFSVERTTVTHAVRFCVLSALGLLVSCLTVWAAAHLLHVSALWGTAATAVLVPLLSFVVMKTWVFVQASE